MELVRGASIGIGCQHLRRDPFQKGNSFLVVMLQLQICRSLQDLSCWDSFSSADNVSFCSSRAVFSAFMEPNLVCRIQVAGRDLAVFVKRKIPFGCQELQDVVGVLHNSGRYFPPSCRCRPRDARRIASPRRAPFLSSQYIRYYQSNSFS